MEFSAPMAPLRQMKHPVSFIKIPVTVLQLLDECDCKQCGAFVGRHHCSYMGNSLLLTYLKDSFTALVNCFQIIYSPANAWAFNN